MTCSPFSSSAQALSAKAEPLLAALVPCLKQSWITIRALSPFSGCICMAKLGTLAVMAHNNCVIASKAGPAMQA